jgi:hypothetical protein
MILVKLKPGEAFQIWIVKRSKKHVKIKWNILWQRGFSGAKISPLGVWPNKVEDAEGLRRGLSIPGPVFIHLIIGLLDHTLNDFSDLQLLLNGLFEKLESGLPLLDLVVLKHVEKPFLVLE